MSKEIQLDFWRLIRLLRLYKKVTGNDICIQIWADYSGSFKMGYTELATFKGIMDGCIELTEIIVDEAGKAKGYTDET